MFLVCVSCRRGKTTKQQNESCEYTDRKRMFHCVCIMKKLYTVILKHGGGGGEYLCGGGNGGLSTVYMGVGVGDCLHGGEGGDYLRVGGNGGLST